ncbi:MAG: TetR/AcrR family transcriptional regulator [Desulfobacteraceae bacterium]|nr:TetR/AcrR family transcriptional regulator [Desulfobacteraceae bacterium]
MGRKSLADENRLKIVQAFYRCVVNEGFAKSSIRKVAKEAEVLPSTLHHYFKDRNEMIAETVDYFTKLISNGFIPPKKQQKDGNDLMFEGLEYIFSSAMINNEHTGFFLECMAEARHNPKVRDSIAKLFCHFREVIIDQLSNNKAFKHLDDPQKKVLASMIIAMHEGVELQWFADSNAVSLEDSLNFAKKLMTKM